VTKVSEINNSSNTGFNVGIFMAPPSKGIISSHTELLFPSRDTIIKRIRTPALLILIILCCLNTCVSTLPNFSRSSLVAR
jgi:hypothetical protein